MGFKVKQGRLTVKFKVDNIRGSKPINLAEATNKKVTELNKGIKKKL